MKIKKHFFSFLLILLHTAALTAQTNKIKGTIEELEQDLKTNLADTIRVNRLFQLAALYNEKGNTKDALRCGMESIKLAESIHYISGCAGAHNNTGNIYYAQGNYPEALKCYLSGLKYAELSKNKSAMSQSTVNVGIIYAVQEDYDNAIKYFEAGSEIMKGTNDSIGLANLYSNLGSLYSLQGNNEKAIISDSLSILTYGAKGPETEIISTLTNMGEMYIQLGNYQRALKYSVDALTMAEKIKNSSGICYAYANIGKIYLKQKKYSDAITNLNKGLAVAKEIGSLNDMSTIYRNLSDVYIAQNNYKEALENYINHKVYKDSTFNEENTKKIVATQMQYDFDKKEAAAKAAQDIKDAIATEEIQKQKIVILSVILGSSLVVMILLLFINRRKAKHNLQVNKLENKTLRAQLNPHFIFNALASIQRYMNEHPEQAQNYLAKFGKLMREVLENSEKEYISLEDEFAMLKKYMDLETLRVTNGFDYEFIIHQNADAETIQVPPLLFQPVIENAIWHGVANGMSKGKIIISVNKENEMLKVEVENISASSTSERMVAEPVEAGKKKSFGLQIVRERLELLSKEKRRKGRIELLPMENGMKVTVEIPV